MTGFRQLAKGAGGGTRAKLRTQRRHANEILAGTLTNVATQLYEDIAIGVFAFGCKLAEERLAERYNTKRHVIRDAFVHLEVIGYVERIPNRGVFVSEPSPKTVREIYEVRAVLEKHAARLTALPAPVKITERMLAIQERHAHAFRSSDFRGVLRLNSEFHQTQFSACRNETLVGAIREFARSTHQITALKFGHETDMMKVIDQHHAIIRALQGACNDRLVDAIEQHFNLRRVEEYAALYKSRHGCGGRSETVSREGARRSPPIPPA